MESDSRPLVSVEEPRTVDLTKAVVDNLNGPGTFDRNRSAPDSPDIRGLLDEFEAATRLVGSSRREDLNDRYDEVYAAARTDLESAFSVLREEVERLRRDVIAAEDAEHRTKSELARLQAEQLTAKNELHECGWLLREPLDFNSKGDQEKIREARTRIAKLHNDLARSLYTERQP